MMIRLIAMAILANHPGDIARNCLGLIWDGEKIRPVAFHKSSPPSHQNDEALHIMGHKPCRLPRVRFLIHKVVIGL